MFSFTELARESENDRRHRGSIEVAGDYIDPCKPAWFVMGKLTVVLVVVAFGYVLALRQIEYPIVKLTGMYFGIALIYCGASYLIRPRANTSNLGRLGGMVDDPTQYSDDINRRLMHLEMLLQPGQVAAEAFLDFCNLIGLHQAAETVADPPEEHSNARRLAPDRFDR